MKRTSVILIQPNYQVLGRASLYGKHPPIGLCYLAAVLEKNRIPVKILDANINNLTVEEVKQKILKSKARIVGMSILTPVHNWAAALARALPQNILKIAGGAHATGLPEDLLKEGFDGVVRSEGEEPFLEIVQGKPLPYIKNLSYKNKRGQIIHNPIRPKLDPHRIPFPARHLLLYGGTRLPYASEGTRYFPWASIFSSRGCPFNCYFCNKLTFGQRFGARNPENVIKEIDWLVRKYKIKELDFYDDCFNFDIERAEKILDLIIKRGYKLHLRFSNGIRADKMTPRLLEKMKQAGTDYIAYGVESGNQKILQQIPKAETLDQIREAFRLTKNAGIPTTGFFIVGLIGDTKKTMQDTINFAKELNPDVALINIATPYPGTRMWEIIKKTPGAKLYLQNWDDFHHTAGKLLYWLPGMARPKVVEEMYRRFTREFYFRPKYILRQIFKIWQPGFLRMASMGLKRILFATK